MPADSSLASGWSACTRAARSASRAKAGPGSASRGATAISPHSRSPAAVATASASAGTSSGAAPPRAATAPARTARRIKGVQPETKSAITSSARDGRRAAVLTERLGHAQEALERERYDDARRIASTVLTTLEGYPYRTKDWGEMNRNLFSALRLERPVTAERASR